jgi:MFS family permease
MSLLTETASENDETMTRSKVKSSERTGLMSAGQARILLAATVGNFVSPTPALLTVFGMVLVPITQEFGWPRTLASGVLGISAIVMALTLVPIGWLMDRIGPRPIALFGNLTFAAAMAAFTLTPNNPVIYYALFILAGFFGTFALPVIYSRAVAGWFNKGRGSALGFVAGAGNGLGASFLPIIAGIILTHYGWRAAYQGVALLVVGLGFPILFFFMKNPALTASKEAVTAVPVDGMAFGDILKSRAFWILAIAVGLCAASLTAMFTQVIPVLTDRHFSLGQAITVLTVFSLTCALWQWIMGFLLDRAKRAWVLAPFYFLAAGGLLLLQYGTSDLHLILGGVLMGLGLGAEYSAVPFLVSRYFGLKSYGRAVSLIYSGISIMLGLVPLFMNAIYDLDKSYSYALFAIEGIMVLAALSLFLLPRHDRMIGQD